MVNLAFPVFRRAQVDPGRLAMVVDDRSITYGDFACAAGRVAAWLRQRGGAERAPRVGVLAARSLETYAGILGTAWAGATWVPLNPKQPSARLASMMRRAGIDALVVDARGAAHLKDLQPVLPRHVLVGLEDVADLSPANAPAAVSPDHPAYIIFTSGTTGQPKGVIVTTANLTHFLAAVRDLYHIGPEDRCGQFCEASFDYSVYEMFSAWDGGASLHVVPEGQVMLPAGFIRKHALTVWTGVPSIISMLDRLKQLQPGSFPALRLSGFGGETFSVASALAWQAAAPNSIVDNHYGPTETTIFCITQRLSSPPLETPGRGTLPIGTPLPDTSVGIVGKAGDFLRDDEVGELAITGPMLALGYIGDSEQTARRFPILDHPELGQSRWYLTGDLALRDGAGRFHHLGRTDHQVKVMGFRVELEEIEAHLRAVCGTDAVAAIAWPVVGGHASGIVAFVRHGHLEGGAVREALRLRVPPYMVPRQVKMLDALPLSAHGKIDRAALSAMLEGRGVS